MKTQLNPERNPKYPPMGSDSKQKLRQFQETHALETAIICYHS